MKPQTHANTFREMHRKNVTASYHTYNHTQHTHSDLHGHMWKCHWFLAQCSAVSGQLWPAGECGFGEFHLCDKSDGSRGTTHTVTVLTLQENQFI